MAAAGGGPVTTPPPARPQPAARSQTFAQRVALFLVPPLAAALVRVAGATLRYDDRLALGAVRGDLLPGPSVYAFWHRSLLIAAHRFRDRGIAILISRSFDGELIARTVTRLGFRVVRGSSSRDGAGGLRRLADAYAQGCRCAFTADGPRGPARVAKPGAAQLAQLTGAEAVGVFTLTPASAWTLKTWDGFLIPRPFSRVLVTWPNPAAPEIAAVQAALDEGDRMAAADPATA